MDAAADEFEFFLQKEWSDGFPVVTPTEDRVERMLAGTRVDPDRVVGNIPPAMGMATVRTVAVHAVMAGCRPEHLPIVMGGISLMLRPELNLNAVQGTMGAGAPLMIVSGPYARKAGLHGGNGCFGPGFRANASIGRAIRLMLTNLGGGVPGLGSSTVFSSPLRYTACITENLDKGPWESLAVSKGYSAEANVITCAMTDPPRYCFDDSSTDPERLLTGIADTMSALSMMNMSVPRCAMVVVMCPTQAQICSSAGMGRSQVMKRLRELAGRTVRELRKGGTWRTERAEKLNINFHDENLFVPAIKHPDDLHLAVAGGSGPFTAVLGGWGGGSIAVHGEYDV